jgi:ATP-dependent helicase/nuclease subunit A
VKLTEQQQRAVEHRGSSLLLAASAGAGKTSVLAQRCLNLLSDPQHPCPVDRLLVVTFTRAAAAELRVRIAALLHQGAAGAADEAQRRWLERQACLIDEAEIGTIDAWCGRLVREHFVEAGADPGFTVLTPASAELLRADLLDELMCWVATADAQAAAAARDWIGRHAGADDGFLRSMIRVLNRYREQLVDPEHWLARQRARWSGDAAAVASACRAEVAAAIEQECVFQRSQLASLLPRFGPDVRGALQGYDNALADWQRGAADGADVRRLVERIGGFDWPRKPRGLADECSALRERIRDEWFRKRLKDRWPLDRITAMLDGAAESARLVLTLLDLEARYEASLQAAKRARSSYEFGDVLRKALDVLSVGTGQRRRPSPVALALRQCYEHILVDECQDTSPVQVEILRLVTRDAPGEANRCMVGDVKQSIYGFRQAEPRLFVDQAQAYRERREDGVVMPLTDNFRSHADLLDGLNLLFSALFDPALGGSGYGDDERLTARRVEIDNPTLVAAPRIDVCLIRKPTPANAADDEPADDDEEDLETIEREALAVADDIRRMQAEGVRIPQRNGDAPPVLQPLNYGDMVILLRAAKVKAPMLAAMIRRMGIPCVALGRESLLDAAEVGDIRSILALVTNTRNDLALAAYLRSPPSGLPVDALLAIRRAHPSGPYSAAVDHYIHNGSDAKLRSTLALALETLDRWRSISRQCGVAPLIRRILVDTGLPLFARALPGGQHRAAMLSALQQLAAEFDDADGGGPGEFVDHLDHLTGEEQPAAGGASGGEDAVRVMTIHAAKGLEFPVVYLLDAGARLLRGGGRGGLALDGEMGLGLRFLDYPARIERLTPAFIIGRTAEERRAIEEELRLLYVAATRARERLVIIGHASDPLRKLASLPARPGPLSLIDRLGASSVLEWVVMGARASGALDVRGSTPARIRIIDQPAISRTVTGAPSEQPRPTSSSPWGAEDETWLSDALRFLADPPAGPLSRTPAVLSVGELKQRVAAAWEDGGAPGIDWVALRGLGPPPATPAVASGGASVATEVEMDRDGRDLGVAVHRFLQYVDWRRFVRAAAGGGGDAILRLVNELERQTKLSTRDAAMLPLTDLAWLGATSEAAFIAQHAATCRRELAFVHSLPVVGSDDRVIVRGVIDCLIDTPGGLVLFDYKTDRVADPAALEARTAGYAVQLGMYARAAGEILAHPVQRVALLFLSMQRVVEVDWQAAAPSAVAAQGAA